MSALGFVAQSNDSSPCLRLLNRYFHQANHIFISFLKFFIIIIEDHFYTTIENAEGLANYHLESLEGMGFVAMDPDCARPMAPVYRLYNDDWKDKFIILNYYYTLMKI
jgi:hypothetical protein